LHGQLGQVGGGTGHGYVCHNSLAVDPATRRVFGLVHQQLYRRPRVPPRESAARKREREDRESLLWRKGVADLPAAGEGRRWVDVGDRLADTFEFYDYEIAHGRSFVVRAWQERRIRVGHDPAGRLTNLLPLVRSLPEQARRPLAVPARDGRPSRATEVAVAFAAVRLRVPRNIRGQIRRVPLDVWVVRVWEVAPPPEGTEPVEWLLLTNEPVTTVAEAWEKVDWYSCRWVVEEYHKAQKTGCGIENPQFTRAERLEPMIALLSVVAVALLNLREASRGEEAVGRPAAEVVAAEWVEVLSGWRYRERRAMSVAEFYRALARLGGHLNRRKDHAPGWLVLWRGWEKLQLMVEGARAAERARRPPDETKHNRDP
jgi:hypothetical protein